MKDKDEQIWKIYKEGGGLSILTSRTTSIYISINIPG
jgi:hypothetical protein